MSVAQLLTAFRRLPPWGTVSAPARWRDYEDAARLVQQADPAVLDQALLEFLNEAEADAGDANESRLFLLSRFAFDLPRRAPAEQRRVFKGWTNWPEPDHEGMVDLSWPVRFGAGGPSLLAPYRGSDGPRYGAVEEYRYLRDHFSWRDQPRDPEDNANE